MPSEGARPGVTVILPTHRRPASLARAIHGLARQRDPGVAWDVVVIDNDEAPGSEDAFRAAAAALGDRARLVRETRRGSAHARNRGVAEATGAITAMLDDDVVPDEGWLAALVEPILAGRCDGTGGRVVLDPAVPFPRWLNGEVADYLGQWSLGDRERDVVPGETIVTSTCAFRSDTLRATGGFDPSLGPRGRTPLVNDDALLTRRFREAGGRMRYVPSAVVVHELPPARLRRRYLLRRAYAQGRSDWILDREVYAARRFGGARLILPFLVARMRMRAREGLHRPDVAFHAACDLARVAGCFREAGALTLEGRRARPGD